MILLNSGGQCTSCIYTHVSLPKYFRCGIQSIPCTFETYWGGKYPSMLTLFWHMLISWQMGWFHLASMLLTTQVYLVSKLITLPNVHIFRTHVFIIDQGKWSLRNSKNNLCGLLGIAPIYNDPKCQDRI